MAFIKLKEALGWRTDSEADLARFAPEYREKYQDAFRATADQPVAKTRDASALYKGGGLLARIFKMDSAPHEISEESKARYKSATWIKEDVPIYLYDRPGPGLRYRCGFLYDPKKADIGGAFKSNIGSYSLDLSKAPSCMRVFGYSFVWTVDGIFRNHETVEDLGEAVTKMHRSKHLSKDSWFFMALPHNEVLMKDVDAIAGMLIDERMLTSPSTLAKVITFMHDHLPGRNLYTYDDRKGEMTEYDVGMMTGIFYQMMETVCAKQDLASMHSKL